MRRRYDVSYLKDQGLTSDLDTKLSYLRIVRDARTVSVAVKCVDINWNTKGEGKYLDSP